MDYHKSLCARKPLKNMHISIADQPIEPWRIVAEHERMLAVNTGDFGAAAVFVGTTRNWNDDASICEMSLEHYAGMTEKHLYGIAEQAATRWPLLDVLIVHRIGKLSPGDPIVVVAAWSAHRAEAFDACRFLIEQLKKTAPFWKKERIDGGERWVQCNTPE